MIRVLFRLKAIAASPKDQKEVKVCWTLAKELVEQASQMTADEADEGMDADSGANPLNPCGDFNQAMMELGATLCTPTSPAGTECEETN